jgi:hypothetical protein
MDRASPRAERGSKLAGLVSRIVYGLPIQEGRVGLDWPIKGLGQVDARFNARGSDLRIPNGSSQYPVTGDGRALKKQRRPGLREGGDGRRRAPRRRSAIAAPPWFHSDLLLLLALLLVVSLTPELRRPRSGRPPPRAEKAKIRTSPSPQPRTPSAPSASATSTAPPPGSSSGGTTTTLASSSLVGMISFIDDRFVLQLGVRFVSLVVDYVPRFILMYSQWLSLQIHLAVYTQLRFSREVQMHYSLHFS